jgi:hypothetical protein
MSNITSEMTENKIQQPLMLPETATLCERLHLKADPKKSHSTAEFQLSTTSNFQQ